MKKAVTTIIILLGVALMGYRAVGGLGAVTALTDYQPWGLVKAVNIFGGAALAAGSFVVAAMVYVFGLRRMRPLVRPALLIGFIGHSFVLIALLYDVGRPLDVWRIITNPQSHSPLLWTAWCELAYTAVMVLELLPDRLGEHSGVGNVLRKFKAPLVIFSAALAVMYQATLGTLYLASPDRISPYWYSDLLPVMFLLSAAAAGLGVLVVVASRSREFEPYHVRALAGTMGLVLILYLCIRFGSLMAFGLLICSYPGCARMESVWILAELLVGGALPVVLLGASFFLQSKGGLVGASILCVLGVVMNRVGVAMIGWHNPPGHGYVPSFMEFYASFFFIFAAVIIYLYAAGKTARP